MNKGNLKITVDTQETTASLLMLRQQIEQTEAENERLRKSIEALERPPWYKGIPPIQWVTLIAIIVNIVIEAVR